MSVTKIQTVQALDDQISNAGNKLVVIDFTAAWCGPCRMISPKYEKFAAEFQGVIFLKVDVDENSEAAEKHNVAAMPTFMFFKNGVDLKCTVTGANEVALKSAIEKHK